MLVKKQQLETYMEQLTGSGQMVTAAMNLEFRWLLLLGKKAMTNLDRVLKIKDVTLPAKVHVVKSSVSISQVWLWELDNREGGELKNWCFLTVGLGRISDSSMDSKEIKPINLKGNSYWKDWFLSWSSNAFVTWFKQSTYLKNPDAGKGRKEKEKRVTEDEMTGWYYWCTGHKRANSGRWWGTGRPGVLQSMELSRVSFEWENEQNKKKGCKVAQK